jgi:hypothetical protein
MRRHAVRGRSGAARGVEEAGCAITQCWGGRRRRHTVLGRPAAEVGAGFI